MKLLNAIQSLVKTPIHQIATLPNLDEIATAIPKWLHLNMVLFSSTMGLCSALLWAALIPGLLALSNLVWIPLFAVVIYLAWKIPKALFCSMIGLCSALLWVALTSDLLLFSTSVWLSLLATLATLTTVVMTYLAWKIRAAEMLGDSEDHCKQALNAIERCPKAREWRDQVLQSGRALRIADYHRMQNLLQELYTLEYKDLRSTNIKRFGGEEATKMATSRYRRMQKWLIALALLGGIFSTQMDIHIPILEISSPGVLLFFVILALLLVNYALVLRYKPVGIDVFLSKKLSDICLDSSLAASYIAERVSAGHAILHKDIEIAERHARGYCKMVHDISEISK